MRGNENGSGWMGFTNINWCYRFLVANKSKKPQCDAIMQGEWIVRGKKVWIDMMLEIPLACLAGGKKFAKHFDGFLHRIKMILLI